MSAAAAVSAKPPPCKPARKRLRRLALYAFLTVMAVTWLFPLLWAILIALRPISDTQVNGYLSMPASLSLDNFATAWNRQNMPNFFLNTFIITVPAVLITLWLASMVAFAIARYSWKLNLVALLFFTAANLLPPQALIIPIHRLFLTLPIPKAISEFGLLYDQHLGIILIHVAFQMGFCVFVLANYMKTIPHDLTEAAIVDGASVFTAYRKVIMPLIRPALAALGVLLTTWIYNDFFWALFLFKTGDKRPITSALNSIKGEYFTDFNLLAAGALIAAIPTVIVFLLLQRHFIRGLTLGSTKG